MASSVSLNRLLLNTDYSLTINALRSLAPLFHLLGCAHLVGMEDGGGVSRRGGPRRGLSGGFGWLAGEVAEVQDDPLQSLQRHRQALGLPAVYHRGRGRH